MFGMSQLPSHPGADGPRSGEARSCNRERAGSEFPGVHAVPPARVRGSSDVQNSCPPGLRASYGHAGGTPAHPARTWLNHVAFRYRRVPLAPRSPLASRFSLLASRFSPLASLLSPHPLSPLASLVSRLLPHPLSPHPLATVPAAGPGAAPLRPSTLSSHVQRATCNLQPLAPRAPRHCPRRRSGRSAAAPFHVVVPRATCNVQPSTFNLQRHTRPTGIGSAAQSAVFGIDADYLHQPE